MSGDGAHAVGVSVVAASARAGADVPYPHGGVVRAGTQGGVSCGEKRTAEPLGVRTELAEDGSRAHVEELDPSLLAADGERLAVVAEDAAVGDILKAGEGSRVERRLCELKMETRAEEVTAS